MKMHELLIRKPQKRTQRKIHYFLGVLFAVFVVCGLASETVHAQEYYPFLQVDVGRSNNEAELQEGFFSFTALDSGAVFNGITVELESTPGDDGAAGVGKDPLHSLPYPAP